MIVDSLVVELGLDPTKFNKGQQQALQSFKQTQDVALKGAKDIEFQSGKTTEAIGGIRSATLGMFAAITGATGLVQFAAQSIHAGAAVGRLSRNIGVSVDVISRFQGLAQVFGGSAEGMASSFTQISDALEGWKIGDVKGIVADFRALGSAGGTIIDINKGVEQTFLDIAKNLKVLHDRDPALGGYWQRRLGLDPGLYDAMIQKNETFAEQLRKIRGLTDEEADAAGRAERQWNKLVQTVTKVGQNFILDQVQKTIDDINDPKTILGMVFGSKKGGSAEATTASTEGAPAGAGAFNSQVEKEAFIRQSAVKAGINPDVAMAVARSEGFSSFLGDNGTSGGAFQLHVTPGGRGHAVGDEFKRLTGLDPLDPKNEHESVMFAMEWAKRHGWGDFHGAANGAHLSAWDGIGGNNHSTTTSSVTVTGPINVYPPPGTDGGAMAGKFVDTLKRQSYAAQANDGQN